MFKRSLSFFMQFIKIIRVEYSFTKSRRDHIIGSQTRVIECRLVGIERLPGWTQNNYGLRYRVGNPAKFAFIVPQCLFSLLKRVEVSACARPSDNFARLVA